MIVVADTTPLNYLILIGAVGVLESLFGKVLIPSAVYEELTVSKTPPAVRGWIEDHPAWVEVHQVTSNPQLPVLDVGETEAITLALSVRADLLLMDERKGRALAAAQGIAFTGTLGVLQRADAAGLINLANAIARLRQTPFQMSEELIQRILKRQS